MKIAMIGDLHYPSIDETIPGLKESRSVFYERFLKQFLETEADFHVSIGDLTNFGTESELRDIYGLINQSNATFYHAIGNHDVYSMTAREVVEITGQPLYHSFETEKAVFAFLNTARDMDYDDWGGWVDEEQLSWVEEVVRASGEKPLLVFAHHPVYRTTIHSDAEKGSIHPDVDMWRVLEQKKGIGFYFNGHIHVDSIVRQKNWTFVQKSACLDEHALRLIEITENEITVKAVDLDDPILAENARFISRHINHFNSHPAARGTDENRECRIPLIAVESAL